MQDAQMSRDPASGYAGADALDSSDPVNRDRSSETHEETQDAMSGYATADVLDPDGDDSA